MDNGADTDSKYRRKAQQAEEQIEALKAELEKTKRKQDAIMTDSSKLLPSKFFPCVFSLALTDLLCCPTETKVVAAVARPKGASLANPTKKARKYQALEFASDEE